MSKKILITGSSGFIGGYVVRELLERGYTVIGLDDHSKYGPMASTIPEHPEFQFHAGDARDVDLVKGLLADCDHFLAGAAMIGGISYFHEYAYDLIAANERITAAAFDAAIWAHQNARLEKITVMSSSMVFESTTEVPTPEGAERRSPPPLSTYGFQKLACEYFARGALQQYRLPYTIIRPFNCVGVGEHRAAGDKEVLSGDVKLAMSHVVPDLIQKVLRGQDPLHILGDGSQVRHYTYGGDIARGVALALEHPAARNEDFNVSVDRSTTVLELAEMIWERINPGKPFRHVSDPPFEHDVKVRIPDVSKAERVLGFKATTSLEETLDVVIPWVRQAIEAGTI